MHWTARLTQYEFSPEAEIAADLACSGCGYNLRSLRAGGRCPECGSAIEATLRAARDATTTSNAIGDLFRAYASAVATLLFAGIGTAVHSCAIPAGMIAALLLWLRFRALRPGTQHDLANWSRAVEIPYRMWWFASIGEIIAMLVVVSSITAEAFMAPQLVARVQPIAEVAWFIWAGIVGVQSVLLGWLERRVAAVLEFPFLRIESFVVMVLSGIFLAMLAACVLLWASGAQPYVVLVMFLAGGAMATVTMIGLLHIANAVMRDRPATAELLTSGR